MAQIILDIPEDNLDLIREMAHEFDYEVEDYNNDPIQFLKDLLSNSVQDKNELSAYLEFVLEG